MATRPESEQPHLSVERCFPRQALAARILLLGALGLLAAGVFTPMVTLEKLLFLRNTFSLAGGIAQLYGEGQWALALLIGSFSVMLPLAKLLMLLRLVGMRWRDGTRLHRSLRWLHRLGRWSMLDVFVVAVLVATVKLGVIAQVQIHAGLYLFAAAVLATMAATGWVVRLADRLERERVGE